MLNKLFRKKLSPSLADLNSGLRIILTARTQETINEAASKGYMPLIKPIIPNPAIKSKFAVLQHPTTGKIEVINDFRAEHHFKEMITVINFMDYNPYNHQSPYAAYLIPKDLKVGEEVWLEDLIENIVGAKWNQGDTYRLPSCKAIWNGKEFSLQISEHSQMIMVG